MSWLARLLSPSKRRAREEELPPSKRVRSIEENLPDKKVASAGYPFNDQEFVSFAEKEDQADLKAILSSILVPRPLTLVASLDQANNLTVAPSTFCTVVSEDPPYVSIGLNKDSLPADSLTDAVSSAIDSKEFTVNLVSEWLVEAVTRIAGSYKHFTPDLEADLAETGFTTTPSVKVSVPRVAQAAVSLECRTKDKVSIKDKKGEVTSIVVIAEVINILANEGVLEEPEEGPISIRLDRLKPAAVAGKDLGGRITGLYPLPLSPPSSVGDPVAPIGPAAAATIASAPPAETDGGPINEDLAVAVATAVAETLDVEPDAPSVEEVRVVLKDVSDAPPARSTRSTRSATARSREATPISVIVQ